MGIDFLQGVLETLANSTVPGIAVHAMDLRSSSAFHLSVINRVNDTGRLSRLMGCCLNARLSGLRAATPGVHELQFGQIEEHLLPCLKVRLGYSYGP